MVQNKALHTAARRYCLDRFDSWCQQYRELEQRQGWKIQNKFEPGWDYSDEAYQIFPRYRLAKAIRIEIERIHPDLCPQLSELRNLLSEMSDRAEAALRQELKNQIATKALAEECEDF